MDDTIIEALKTYFDACPLLAKNRINIDYLPEDTSEAGIEYSIDTIPADPVLQHYMDGGAMCQYTFAIRSVRDWGPDDLQGITNSGFFEKLTTWLRQQTQRRIFPALPDGMQPRTLEANSTGYLFLTSPHSGKYQVQCRLTYFRKGER